MLVNKNRTSSWLAVCAVCWGLFPITATAGNWFDSGRTRPLTTTFGGVGRGGSEFIVEAIFSEFDTPNARVGHPRAPDSFNDFPVPNMLAMDGATVGTQTPSVVGQSSGVDNANGIRLKWNYTTEDYGRIQFTGFWLGDATQHFKRGLGTMTSGADPDTVSVTAATGYGDGSGGGHTVPFDQYYRIELESTATGLSGDFAPSGYWWGATLFQPTIGARYVSVDEVFSMAGADSGLDYEHEASGAPVESSLDPPVVAFPPYTARLRSSADNELYGPQIGINFLTTGKTLRFGGESRLGIMFGDADLNLRGNTISDTFTANAPFSTSDSESFDSVLFEQSVFMDVNLSHLTDRFDPFTCDNEFILRLGWSLLYLSDVVRPTDTINWLETPQIRSREVDLVLQTWSAGLLIRF